MDPESSPCGGISKSGGGRQNREFKIWGLGSRVGVYTGLPLCEETAIHGSHNGPHSPYFLNSYLTTSKFASFWKMSVLQRPLCQGVSTCCTVHSKEKSLILVHSSPVCPVHSALVFDCRVSWGIQRAAWDFQQFWAQA